MVKQNVMPKVSKANIIDRIGSTIFENLFAHELILIPHNGNKDFGIDYHADIINKKERDLIGHYFGIQLKSHQTIKWNAKKEYKQKVKISSANYWLSCNIPIVLVLIDNEKQMVYGIDIKEQLRNNWDKYDLKKKTLDLVIQQDEEFNTKFYLNCIHNFYKYQLLCESVTDYFLIRYFIVYMSNIDKRDWFLLVDNYSDLTNEILELCNKYSFAFSEKLELKNREIELKRCVEYCLINNKINYEKYIEQTREEFNNKAFVYLTQLVDCICEEVRRDKTNILHNKLFKFLYLQKEINKHNSFRDSYWHETLNFSEYDYLDLI